MQNLKNSVSLVLLLLLVTVVGIRANRYLQFRQNASNHAAMLKNINELRMSEIAIQPPVLSGVKSLGGGNNRNLNGVIVILGDSYDLLSKQQQTVAQKRMFATWLAIVQKNRIGNSKAEIQINDSMYRPVASDTEP